MRSFGTAAELERRRRLAVARYAEGFPVEEIAELLGVQPRSVWRWIAASHNGGTNALAAQPVSGRPPKLTHTQEKIVFRWLDEPPTHWGFATELWTAERLAALIADHFAVSFHPHYLCQWLRDRGYTPQKPTRVPRERNPEVIAQWRTETWGRIKKASGVGTPS